MELILSCLALGALFWERDDNTRDYNQKQRRKRKNAITKNDVISKLLEHQTLRVRIQLDSIIFSIIDCKIYSTGRFLLP